MLHGVPVTTPMVWVPMWPLVASRDPSPHPRSSEQGVCNAGSQAPQVLAGGWRVAARWRLVAGQRACLSIPEE